MQVACGHCGAQYEFDASAIPAAGYDAQCTHCGHIFFVAPDRPDLPTPIPPEEATAKTAESTNPHAQPHPSVQNSAGLVTATCTHCGAIYQFGESAIPAEGYDAQCTQCQGVFFVEGKTVAEPVAAPVPATALAMAPTPTMPPQLAAPAEPAQPISDVAVPPAPPAPRKSIPSLPQEPLDMSEPTKNLGTRTDKSSSELGDAHRKKLRRVWTPVAVVSILGLFSAGTYYLAPRVFDVTVGMALGIKTSIAPEAITIAARANPFMLQDTEEGYKEAISIYDKALVVDPQYSEALAMKGLSHILMGVDLRATAINAVSNQASTGQQPVAKELEEAAAEIGRGIVFLKKGLVAKPTTPMVSVAAGIFYSTDSDLIPRAADSLKDSLEQRLGSGAKLDLNSAPDSWAAFLQGLIFLADPNGKDSAEKAFLSVLRVEPRFNRARWELAQIYQKSGKKVEAENMLREIVGFSAKHTRAAQMLARVTLPLAQPPPPALAPVQEKAPAAAKKKLRARR